MKFLISTSFTLSFFCVVIASQSHNDILYPFGKLNGDESVEKVDDELLEVSLGTQIKIFDSLYSTLHFSTNGFLYFDSIKQLSDEPEPIPFQSLYANVIAPLWTNIDITKGGNIFYRHIIDQTTNDKITNDIKRINNDEHEDYASIFAFMITWYRVAHHSSSNRATTTSTFQVIITTNGTHSFSIFNYGSVKWYFQSQAGYNSENSDNYVTLPGSFSYNINRLESLSNVNTPGKWIFRIDTNNELTRTTNTGTLVNNFKTIYPFGLTNGDTRAPKGDDDFFSLNISATKYFDNSWTSLYISSNGLASFGAGILADNPSIFHHNNIKALAPFWSDINTERCGEIYYREATNIQTLMMISNDVQRLDSTLLGYQASRAYIITWYKVCAFSLSISASWTNTFQLVITTNGTHTFVIYNYDQINWYDYGSTLAGYNAGNGHTYSILVQPYVRSFSKLKSDSNVNKPGKWIFRVDSDSSMDSYETLYPYGLLNNDTRATKLSNSYIRLKLNSFKYFDNKWTTLYLSSNGYIFFDWRYYPINDVEVIKII